MGKVSFHKAATFKFSLKNVLLDPSTWSLLVVNLYINYIALQQQWSLLTLLWIYWCQSVIIGIFSVLRILFVKNYITDGMTMNGKPVPSTSAGKFGVAMFFAFHYGFFHFIYAIFLMAGVVENLITAQQSINIFDVLISAVLFFVNHLYSFVYNFQRTNKTYNIGKLFVFPYMRILPMHLTIIFGSIVANSSLLLFLALKTFSDVMMHAFEHDGK